MKKMLITGASKGIGKAVSEHFCEKFEIIGVSRNSNSPYRGDLTNSNFRKKILNELNPDIFINNASLISNKFDKTFELNVIAAGELMTGFYKKMVSGSQIINITSSCATQSGYENMSDWRINYHTSKLAIKKLSENLAHCKKRSVRVTSLEPAHVNTGLTGGPFEGLIEPEQKNYRSVFYPLPPAYIAQVIGWIIEQPLWVNIESLKILNSHNKQMVDMPLDVS